MKKLLIILVGISFICCTPIGNAVPFPCDMCAFQFTNDAYKDKIIASYINDSTCCIYLTHFIYSSSHNTQDQWSMLSECQEGMSNAFLNEIEVRPLIDNYYYYGAFPHIGVYDAVVLDITWSEINELSYSYHGEMHSGIKAHILSTTPFAKKVWFDGSCLQKYNGHYVWTLEELDNRFNWLIENQKGLNIDVFLQAETLLGSTSHSNYLKKQQEYINNNKERYQYDNSNNQIFIYLTK